MGCLGWIWSRQWLGDMSFMGWIWNTQRTDRVAKVRGRIGPTVPPETGTSKRSIESEELGEQLLPGVLDDITLDLIAPKLNWIDLRTLSSVSSGWRRAIESHVFYARRIRFCATETLVVVAQKSKSYCLDEGFYRVSLYSMRDNAWWTLPSIPYLRTGFPYSCQCVSLDGKIYVVGGAEERPDGTLYMSRGPDFCTNFRGGKNVYVLDPAGKLQWKRCASMREPRLAFGSAVIDGKIHVFGGCSDGKYVTGSEVYDPKANTWSKIKSMIHPRWNHQVAQVGEELLVHGGLFYDGKIHHRRALQVADGLAVGANESTDDETSHVEVEVEDEWTDPLELGEDTFLGPIESSDDDAEDEDEWTDPLELEEDSAVGLVESSEDEGEWCRTKHALFSEAYHPVKDEWRLIEPFGENILESVFVAHGKLYGMDQHDIYVHDTEKNSWTLLQSCFFAGITPMEDIIPFRTLAVDDELLLSAVRHEKATGIYEWVLFRSKGFGNKDEAVVWEKNHAQRSLVDEILTQVDSLKPIAKQWGTFDIRTRKSAAEWKYKWITSVFQPGLSAFAAV